MVVVTLLQGAAEILAGLVISCTLGEGPGATSIEASDGTGNLSVRAVARLRVVVAKNTGFLDVVAGEVVAGGVLGEGLERRVAVLRLTLVPLRHGAVDVAIGHVSIGNDELVHGEQTINVGVMEPEDGVERGHVKVVHVTTGFTTSSVVDSIVDRFEAVASRQICAYANSRSTGRAPRLLAGEQRKDTVTERDALGIEASIHLVVVAASGVGNRAAKCLGEVVPGASSHLRGERAAEAVGIEGVVDGNSALGLGDGNLLIADHRRDSRLVRARVLSPIPVGHTECGRSVPPALLLARGEGADDLLDALVPSLLPRLLAYVWICCGVQNVPHRWQGRACARFRRESAHGDRNQPG